MTSKVYLSANSLLEDSYRLAIQIWESEFRPTVIIGVWRGGTPIAVAVHELLAYLGTDAAHYPIRTSSYTGIAKRAGDVQVMGLGPIAQQLTAQDRVLFVDDVFDTGLSMDATLETLDRARPGPGPAEVRVATVYYKPDSNQTQRTPDFYIHKTAQWLVFPHELKGLSAEEILRDKPGAHVLRSVLAADIEA